MNTKSLLRNTLFICGVVLLSLLWTDHSSAMRSTHGQADNAAAILNSGSTNTCSYTIYVHRNSAASYIVCDLSFGEGQLPSRLTSKFFHDIATAQPLAALPRQQPCIKAISFGSSTRIEYGLQKSPDVSCSANQLGEQLANDARMIQEALHFSLMRQVYLNPEGKQS